MTTLAEGAKYQRERYLAVTGRLKPGVECLFLFFPFSRAYRRKLSAQCLKKRGSCATHACLTHAHALQRDRTGLVPRPTALRWLHITTCAPMNAPFLWSGRSLAPRTERVLHPLSAPGRVSECLFVCIHRKRRHQKRRDGVQGRALIAPPLENGKFLHKKDTVCRKRVCSRPLPNGVQVCVPRGGRKLGKRRQCTRCFKL